MQPVSIELLDDDVSCQSLEAVLVERLYEFSAAATGHLDGRLMGGRLRDAAGELIAGFSGHTWGGVCVLTHLWVASTQRGLGHGRRLLERAEGEALRRGCADSLLMTHAFQAPGFYERTGYRRICAIADWPAGHMNLVYRKKLWTSPALAGMPIDVFHGDRRALLPLFALADDSTAQVLKYLELGEVIVARDGEEVVGHLQIVATDEPDVVEIRSLAVMERWQGMGIGGRLIEAAVSRCRRVCAHRLIVATAAADLGNLRFYQRREFRMRRVVQDVFVASAGYPEARNVDGIELRDQVVLERDFRCPSERAETSPGRTSSSAKR